MSFSPEWLALREAVDHRSRSAALAAEVRQHFAGRSLIRIADLGCGTGSNLRASYALYPPRQEWLLIDHDPALLIAAREAIQDWADRFRPGDGLIQIVKDTFDITVRFAQADLAKDLPKVLAGRHDLITASALFDLVSEDWTRHLAAGAKAAGTAFYTVLTYDGRDAFSPPHPLDEEVLRAFGRHQRQDKGLGIAAGPDSAAMLMRVFSGEGFFVSEGDSPWRLGTADAALAKALLPGIAAAVRETGEVAEAAVDAWLTFRLSIAGDGIVIGHTDTFAR